MNSSRPEKLKILSHLLETVHRLRAPGGCPWDRSQTHLSLRPYLIEEAYEVLEVIDQIKSDENVTQPEIQAPFKEELGDLLMQVLLHSEMASEKQAFDFYDVAQALDEKLVRRHPHVFEENQSVKNADQAFQNWEKQKALEKEAQGKNSKGKKSILDGLPRNLPSLQRSERLIEKVTKVGFQWKDLKGPMNKVSEEWEELRAEIETPQPDLKKIESELGDVLLTLCNLASVLKIHPEDALRSTLQKFERRFRYVETKLHELGKTPEQSNLEEMDQFWNEAKQTENP